MSSPAPISAETGVPTVLSTPFCAEEVDSLIGDLFANNEGVAHHVAFIYFVRLYDYYMVEGEVDWNKVAVFSKHCTAHEFINNDERRSSSPMEESA